MRDKNDLNKIKELLRPIFRKYPVARAGIFGSVVTKPLDKANDVDILFEKKGKISFRQYSNMYDEIEQALGKKIDLVQYNLIKPALKDYILPNEVRIYEQNS
jgi:hypothetical protein